MGLGYWVPMDTVGLMTTDHADALSEDTTGSETAATPPAPAGESPQGGESGPMVALETGGNWVLGRESEGTDDDGRKRAVFEDGSVRTYKNRPGTVRSVTPGTMLHRLVQEPDAMKERVRTAPADVIVEVLDEVRVPLSKKEIEAKLDDLRLLPDEGWWTRAARELKQHPRVKVERGRYGLVRSD